MTGMRKSIEDPQNSDELPQLVLSAIWHSKPPVILPPIFQVKTSSPEQAVRKIHKTDLETSWIFSATDDISKVEAKEYPLVIAFSPFAPTPAG
jgi:hypothetical protein